MKAMNTESELLVATDLCVKCGLCLPHCPTYNKTQDENESPRGRIELIQAWATRRLPSSKQLLMHLDNCLLCRSCERVCPARVPYGRLVDQFRMRQQQSPLVKSSFRMAGIRGLAHHRRVRHLAKTALNIYRSSGLDKTGVLRSLGLRSIERLLPAKPDHEKAGRHLGVYPAAGDVRGDVGLFVGCMGRLLDNATIEAAINVLNQSGFNVHVPGQQTCCGAFALHSGDKEMATRLADANVAAFSSHSTLATITLASGCGAVLKEYGERSFGSGIIDISRFLYETDALAVLDLRSFTAKIGIHTPCSLRNVMGEHDYVIQLLSQIPGFEVMPLPERIACCGSAGSYMVEHPVMAERILQDVLRAVEKQQPEYLVSSNIGCILHISAGLRENHIKTQVLHPVALLNQLLAM